MDYDKYSKIFWALEDLAKVDMSLSEALKVARKSNPDVANVLARHIYTDTLVPKVGNKFAYGDFLSRHGSSGVHISLDGNSFGSINKEYSHDHGDEAIKQMFNTISEVSRKYGLKAFRTGGDEGKLHASTPERAHGFAKELQTALAALPPVAGTKHRLSVSLGIGFTPQHAEKALTHAKEQLGPLVDGKRSKYNLPGQEQTVFHSLLHESPPVGWTPSNGKTPALPHEETEKDSFSTPGLKYSNPLKDKK